MSSTPPASLSKEVEESLRQAAAELRACDALLICTGAGMGVASGLGTFRGANAGIWPPLEKRGICFTDMSNPRSFVRDERFAWAFWQFRHACYTAAKPHAGYRLLHALGETKPHGAFSFTSNIDGHWLDVGMAEDRVYEVHGSLRHMQCTNGMCSDSVWPTDDAFIANMTVDAATDRVTSALPTCGTCGRTARPNVLMFGDRHFVTVRDEEQEDNYRRWKSRVERSDVRLAIIEIGAGRAVPTVRNESFVVAAETGATVIRINPEDPEPDRIQRCISIPLGSGEALEAIGRHLDG